MIRYLKVDDLRQIAEALGEPAVRDVGLLSAAAHRPQVSVGGEDAYASLELKAAALLDAIVRNHPLVDGNKRLGWVATAVFFRLNGYRIRAATDDAEDLVMAVADGHLPLETVAEQLKSWLMAEIAPRDPLA